MLHIKNTYSTGVGQVTIETDDGLTICLSLRETSEGILVSGTSFDVEGNEGVVL